MEGGEERQGEIKRGRGRTQNVREQCDEHNLKNKNIYTTILLVIELGPNSSKENLKSDLYPLWIVASRDCVMLLKTI